MNKSIDLAQAGKRSLMQHVTIMLVACTLLQAVISVRGNQIDLVSELLLGAVGLYYLWYHYISHDQLSRLRFGRLVAHLAGFLIINLSYHLHAFILFITNNTAIRGDENFPIDPGWFGVLFGMATFWGIGLLTHLVASIAKRGFEELPRG